MQLKSGEHEAMMALLAEWNLIGSDAETSMRTVVERAPVSSLADLVALLRSVSHLSLEQRHNQWRSLFGTDALRVLDVLFRWYPT